MKRSASWDQKATEDVEEDPGSEGDQVPQGGLDRRDLPENMDLSDHEDRWA